MTVYMVTTGEYSDYHVCGIYSTREKAVRAADEYQGEFCEMELDAASEVPEGLLPFVVYMNRNGDASQIRRAGVDDFCTPRGQFFWGPYRGREGDEDEVQFEVFAKDEAHAVKIANERRAVLIAENNWGKDYHELHRTESVQ